jgi:hypothetical protein
VYGALYPRARELPPIKVGEVGEVGEAAAPQRFPRPYLPWVARAEVGEVAAQHAGDGPCLARRPAESEKK